MKSEHMEQFENLASRLSPENLHCDGEISRAQAMVRFRQIKREWKALEKLAGEKVTQEQAENWMVENWRAEK